MLKRLERHKPHTIYRKDGKRVVGASTVAGVNKPADPLMGWAAKLAREGKDWRTERNSTADYGAISHFLIECYLEGSEPDLSEFTEEEIKVGRVAYEKFLRFWEREKIEVVASEVRLTSNILDYGGTLDLVGRKDELILFDWKTSKRVYDSHLIQAAGYHHLWNEHNEPLARTCIVRVGREHGGESETHWIPPEMMSKYWDCFYHRLNVYYADKAIRYL